MSRAAVPVERPGEAPRPRGAVAWAFYDFANTIFSMNVLTMYLAQWVVVDRGVEDVWYSLAYSVSMALVALTLPILGALADQKTGGRLRFLLGFTISAVLGTVVIGLAATKSPGNAAVPLALLAFAMANYAFQGSLVFYNSLLPLVSTPATIGRVSGFGVALGYLGAIAGLLLVSPFVDGKIPFTGIELGWPPAGGRAAAFIPTAFFFALFALPLFLRLKTDRLPGHEGGPPDAVRPGWKAAVKGVMEGIRDTSRYPGVRRFLIANYLFVDAINTVILFMAVYAQEVMGMPDSVKITFFIVATTGAVIGSLLLGQASDRFGPRRVLGWVLGGWVVALSTVALTRETGLFWAAGVLVGVCLGGTWTTSRALLANLTPPEAHGRFFGLYALSDKAAAVIGPLVWGIIVWAGKPLGPLRYRLAVGSLVLFVLGGLFLLRGVPEARTARSGSTA
jgi:UMF1 family MFS transporter